MLIIEKDSSCAIDTLYFIDQVVCRRLASQQMEKLPGITGPGRKVCANDNGLSLFDGECLTGDDLVHSLLTWRCGATSRLGNANDRSPYVRLFFDVDRSFGLS